MAWTPVLRGSTRYPELLLEWAPTSLPTDASQSWEDITDRLRAWDWGYGRNDELGVFEAGTGSVVLDNRDRELDPSYDAGAWFGNIKPRRMFRLRAKYATVEYPIFVAYSHGFPQTYLGAGFDKVVKVDLVDAYAILQKFDLVVGFSRPVELCGARVAAVLDAINIPAGLRDLDDCDEMVAAVDVTEATSGLDHCRSVAASAFGQLFVAKDGKVTLHGRHRRLNATSLHTFSDATGASLRYADGFEPDWDETYLRNHVLVTGLTDAEPGEAEDTASQDDYHEIVHTVSTLLEYEHDRQSLAEYHTLLYAQPQLRAPELPLNGASNPSAMWPVVLDLEISDRVTVTRFASSADPMTLVQNVEGIRHSCGPGGPWLTAVATSPADERTYWKLEDLVYGEIDNPDIVIAP